MCDLANRAYRAGYPVFSDFLTAKEYAVLNRIKREFRDIRSVFFGGHSDCDHVMAGFFPGSWPQEEELLLFPISAIRIIPGKGYHGQRPGHRDYLGAVMNLGMERSRIGDIRICDEAAFLFCRKEFCSFILENLTMVRHMPVICEQIHDFGQFPPQRTEQWNSSVASARLDNIVAAVTGLSRTKAADQIRRGFVIADHEEQDSVSYLCRDGSVLTVRGYGKFRIDVPEHSLTKKGRQKIVIYKYL